MTFSPRTWVVGETVTAALMNQEIRDQISSMLGAWTPYTPTWIAQSGGTPSIGNGTIFADYIKIGRTVHFRIHLTWGSTTTGGGANANWAFTLPSAPSTTSWKLSHRGNIKVLASKSGGNMFGGTAAISTSNGGICQGFRDDNNVSAAFWDQDAGAPLASWAANDTLSVAGWYESAA